MSPRALLIGVSCAVAIAGGAIFAGCGGEDPKPRTLSAAERLTVDQLVGQRIVAGFTGSKPPKKLLTAVRAGKVGGVILFADNTPTKKITQRNTMRLQRAARLGKQPYLLILTDQEGGDVKRLAWAPPDKSPAEMGRASDPGQEAHSAGTLTGSALRQVGVNVDLAPVADVADANTVVTAATPAVTGASTSVTGPTAPPPVSQPSFLGSRSFSGNPQTTATAACAFATGLQNAGVAATFKHFPGLGRAPANTDFTAVEVNASSRAIKSDFRPYKRCAKTPKLVMVSSAKYPSLGIDKAAALIPQTYTLLNETGFKGLTITDAFDTPAIKEYKNPAGRALLAGADLLLYGQVTHHATDAHASLIKQVQAKQLSKSDLQVAAAKILALKSQIKSGSWAP